jgi:hypothetical protein
MERRRVWISKKRNLKRKQSGGNDVSAKDQSLWLYLLRFQPSPSTALLDVR